MTNLPKALRELLQKNFPLQIWDWFAGKFA